MIVGLAGHIDHGKTALVRALTGVDGDRLKEEKARGITIDLGFAYLPAPNGRILGFIDVPGHERFVHTMLAGATGIDFVVLTVAADDGVMPQTREHLAIVNILGVKHGLVATTKADLVSPARLNDVTAEIRALLAGTALADADILPVSALTGRGVDALRDRLFAEADRRKSATGAFRLAVDRVFTLAGIGTVVTGTVLSGAVRMNDRVTISPRGLAARVRSLHAQNRAADEAAAGDRCALNLAGEDVSPEAIRRGDVVLDESLHAPTERIDATLQVLANEPKPIGEWFPVRLHHGAAEVGARLLPLDRAPIAPGANCKVQLVLERPLAAACGDRYVIRDVSARRTIGGGTLLDLRAPARRRRTPERLAQLEVLAGADGAEAFLRLLDVPPFVCNLTRFARDHAWSAAEVAALIGRADMVHFDMTREQLALSQRRWQEFRVALEEQVAAYHRANPDAQGIGREKLRLLIKPRLPASVFTAALDELARRGGVVLDSAFVRLPSHAVRLADADEELWAAIESMLGGEQRFRPPRVPDIAGSLRRSEADIRRLLKLSARLGRVDEVAPDHFFLRAAVTAMTGILADLGRDGASFTAAQFRDRVLNGRKVAIHILEFFDRHGITLRRGDARRINGQRLDHFGGSALASAAGRESPPVGRSDFKSEWGRETVSGGFDSHSLPPPSCAGKRPS